MTNSATTEAPTPNMIQELASMSALQAIKDSVQFDGFSAFRAYLEESLPHNSAETRGRYTRTLLELFFPTGTLVWKDGCGFPVLLSTSRLPALRRGSERGLTVAN